MVEVENDVSSLPSAHSPSINLNNVFRANNGERHETAELGVLLDCVFVIFFNIVGKVVAVQYVNKRCY